MLAHRRVVSAAASATLAPLSFLDTMKRSRLQGVPSGLRIRAPLAGMPAFPTIQGAGQVPLPPWASEDEPPVEWAAPPPPSFEEDDERQAELDDLLASLPQLPFSDKAFPVGQRFADAMTTADITPVDVSRLWDDVEAMDADAEKRLAALHHMRSHLQSIAHGLPTRPVGSVNAILDLDEERAGVDGEGEPMSRVSLKLKGVPTFQSAVPPPEADVSAHDGTSMMDTDGGGGGGGGGDGGGGGG